MVSKRETWTEENGVGFYVNDCEEEVVIVKKTRVLAKHKVKVGQTSDIKDFYKLLGLEDITFEAGDKEVKKGYQLCALNFHPDKMGEKKSDRDHEVWLAIQ